MLFTSQLQPGTEVFTWENPDDGITLSFAMTELADFVREANPPVHELAYPDAFDVWLEDNRGATVERSRELTIEQRDSPVIVLLIHGGTLLADGTHRTHRRYQDGLRKGACYIVPEQVWQHFLIVDAPNFTPEAIKHLPTHGLRHRQKGNT